MFDDDLRRATGGMSDAEIASLTAWQRVGFIAQWYLGDKAWATEFRSWCESQGLLIVPANDAGEEA